MTVKTMKGKHVLTYVKSLIKQGSLSSLKISSSDGSVCYLNIPMNIIVVSGLLSPLLSGLAFTLVFVKKCKVEFIEKTDKK